MGTLELRGLRKSFGTVTAVDGIDLSVADGEFFVILGPSGAGKTTTLKSIAGLVDIDEGTVEIAGTEVTQVEPYHRNVAMAFESYALYPQKTVQENLSSPLRSGRTGTYEGKDQQARIDQVTTTLGINHLLGRLPRELSNGQRQRTALGRVLVRPADIYLLDEPLSHLDAKLRAAMRAELKQIAQTSSTTTVYVTHDYQEALALGDRIAVLRKGRFVQVGTPDEVWRRPVDTFVAKSLGQPEINLVDARVQRRRRGLRRRRRALPAACRPRAPRGRARDPRSAPQRDGGRPRAPGRAEWLQLPGRVVLAERLGRQVELDVGVGDEQLIVVEDSDHSPPEGTEVTVQIHLPNVHIFASGEEGEDTARLGSATGRHPAALTEEARP